MIIEALERRSAAGAADDSWYNPGGLFYGGAGIKTKSGAAISEMNAMQLAVVWCCIKILSEDTASLPLHLYRRRKGGGKDKAWADDRYFFLHDRPNPEMTAMSFRETYAAHLLSWGNGYAEIERTGGRVNKAVALWPITPNRVTVRRNSNRKIEYKVGLFSNTGAWGIDGMSNAGGREAVVLPKENMLHTPGLSFNGLVGYSPIAAAREAMGLGKTLEEFGSTYFENGIRPSFIVSVKGNLKDPRARREALEEVYGGLGHVHRIMLLEEAEKIEKIGIPNNEAQFLETRKFQNVDIGTRIYRLHPHMYGEFDKAVGFNSAEQFAVDYATKTLRAWLVRLEQSYNMALLDPSEYGTYFFEHNLEGLLRGDLLTRAQAQILYKRNGVINADEIRSTENLNPIPGGLGAEYIIERNMIGLGDLGADVVPATPPPKVPPAVNEDEAAV
jgi:HK97 family phage portal protein